MIKEFSPTQDLSIATMDDVRKALTEEYTYKKVANEITQVTSITLNMSGYDEILIDIQGSNSANPNFSIGTTWSYTGIQYTGNSITNIAMVSGTTTQPALSSGTGNDNILARVTKNNYTSCGRYVDSSFCTIVGGGSIANFSNFMIGNLALNSKTTVIGVKYV